jgi:homopolymeric O-antigen transport system permease protein
MNLMNDPRTAVFKQSRSVLASMSHAISRSARVDSTSKAGTHAARPLIVIEPTTQWWRLVLRELWTNRELLKVLTERDIKVRYKQTVLGFAWAILQPFMLMVVFSIFFGRFAKMPSDGLPYPIFAYAGLLPWTFFSTAVTNASQSLVNSSHLVSKVYFPRLIVPFAVVGAGLVDFLIAGAFMFLMMAYFGVGWGWQLLLAPFLTLCVLLTALGVGTFLASLTVTYRDFRFVVPFLVQFWMFATPIAFPLSIVPEQWQWLLFLNPMTGIVGGFRSCFLGLPIDWSAIVIAFVSSVILFVAGVAYFKSVEQRFADII